MLGVKPCSGIPGPGDPRHAGSHWRSSAASHAGHQGHLRGFAGLPETGVEGTDGGIAAGGGRRPYTRGPHRGTTAPGAPFALAAATVLVQGRHPRQRRHLPAIQRPQLGELPEQRARHHRPDAGDGAQQVLLLAPHRTRPQRLVQLPIQLGELLAEPDDVGIEGRTQAGARRGRRFCSAVRISSNCRRRARRAASSCATASGSGRGGGCTRAAKRARTRASRASLLARWPVARAKSRTWRGLTTATASPAATSAAVTAVSYPPVASSTTNWGAGRPVPPPGW